MKKTTKLNRSELIKRIVDLPTLKQFTVNSTNERTYASSIAKTLRQAGRIEFQVSSRKNEAGAFVFFIVPA